MNKETDDVGLSKKKLIYAGFIAMGFLNLNLALYILAKFWYYRILCEEEYEKISDHIGLCTRFAYR